MTVRCDLCHQTTINYRVDPETRVFVDLALRDLVVCLACDPQLPEATQKQRKRAEVAENEVLRLRAAEDLLRQSHMTTVRERDELRKRADYFEEQCDTMEAVAFAALGDVSDSCMPTNRVRELAERCAKAEAKIEALKEKK